MNDFYIEHPEELNCQPKKTIGDYVESCGIPVPRRFESLAEARADTLSSKDERELKLPLEVGASMYGGKCNYQTYTELVSSRTQVQLIGRRSSCSCGWKRCLHHKARSCMKHFWLISHYFSPIPPLLHYGWSAGIDQTKQRF